MSLKREVKVALSLRAQPLWFRVVKWAVIVVVTALLWNTRYLWWWMGGGLVLGLSLHFFYRWKTQGWTRAWGGWDDLPSGRE
jgi:hypothetical protein